MMPLWARLLPAFAREVLPAIWDAINAADRRTAERLVQLAVQRRAEHLAAEEALDRASALRKRLK